MLKSESFIRSAFSISFLRMIDTSNVALTYPYYRSNKSLVYSRECKVCFSSNPISRCIFTVCGHWSCLPCGMKLEREGTLSCPFCRTITGWVRMIEESEEKSENETIQPSMSPSSSIYGEEDSYVLHPKTGEIISFEHLRQEANMRGFEDPLAYLEVSVHNKVKING